MPKIPRPFYPKGSKAPLVAGTAMAVSLALSIVLVERYDIMRNLLDTIPSLLFIVLVLTAGKKWPTLLTVPFILSAALMILGAFGEATLSLYYQCGGILMIPAAIVSVILYCRCLLGAIESPARRTAYIGVAFAVILILPWAYVCLNSGFRADYHAWHGISYVRVLGRRLAPELLSLMAYALAVAGLKDTPKGEAHGLSI